MLILFALGVLGGIGWWFWSPVSAYVSGWVRPPDHEPVPTLILEERPFRLVVPAQGHLLGLRTIPIQVPRVRTGSLKIAYLADEGRIIEEGQPLLEFDPSPAQLALLESENRASSLGYQFERDEEQAEGELEILRMNQRAAQEEYEFAQSQIRRDEDIFSRWEIQESLMSAALAEYRKGVLGQQESLRRTITSSNLQILGIEQRKVGTEMDMARETLSSMTVPAPQTGVFIYARLGMTRLEPGLEVWPGQQIGEIASYDRFRAVVQVPEKNIADIRSGLLVAVRLDALPGLDLEGRISQVARMAKQLDREDPRKYFECEVTLAVSPERIMDLKPGMKVKADIELEQFETALVLPRSSVTRTETSWVVHLAEGSEYREVPVTIVGSDHGFYLIEGLNAGQRVCLRNPFSTQRLTLPDFSAPSAPATSQRFVVYYN